jgi:hypothetical protein
MRVKEEGLAVMVTLSESWLRHHQVLPQEQNLHTPRLLNMIPYGTFFKAGNRQIVHICLLRNLESFLWNFFFNSNPQKSGSASESDPSMRYS